eukprot:15476322-Alexandrium_andersonii.AAC.2
MIRAAVVWRGWPTGAINPASSLMTRASAYSLSFRGRGRAFDADRIEAQCPGFLADLRARLRARFPDPAEAQRPFQLVLGDQAD